MTRADNGVRPQRSFPHAHQTQSLPELSQLRGYWEKLSGGGTVTMPLETAIWGDAFGMCTDKFGVQWLINIAGPKQ